MLHVSLVHVIIELVALLFAPKACCFFFLHQNVLHIAIFRLKKTCELMKKTLVLHIETIPTVNCDILCQNLVSCECIQAVRKIHKRQQKCCTKKKKVYRKRNCDIPLSQKYFSILWLILSFNNHFCLNFQLQYVLVFLILPLHA